MKFSAGVLLFRRTPGLEVLLGHMGGPLWARKDLGAWSIPKGEYSSSEDAEAAARREFAEELGVEVTAPLHDLGQTRQRGGKRVRGFAVEFDLDPRTIKSNSFEIEWPPRSGRRQSFPEVDRAQWFTLDDARERINQGQLPLLDRLEALLGSC